MQTTDKRNSMTPEERRIKRQEDKCWKQYWDERKAAEARAESDIEAAYKQLRMEEDDAELGGEEFTPLTVKESREAGFKKRDTDTSKKGRRKKILAARSGHHAKKAAIAKVKQLEASDPA